VSALGLTPRVLEWRRRGRTESFRDRRIHVFTRDGSGIPLLLLHGFPSSSFDWRGLLSAAPESPVLAFDFLGFGLSEKPRDHTYTLAWQADLAEELVRRHLGGGPVVCVAHDMGTSVATELFARDLEERLGIELAGAVLFNGSIVVERASLTRSQKLLRGPLGPLAARLANERVFRHEFSALFSPGHPLSEAEAADQWSLLTHDGGHRLGHRLIHYIDERVTYASRWHGAVRDWPRPLAFAWGLQDPVATVAVLDALRALRPHAPVDELADLGHYPQIEDPDAIAASVRTAVSRSVGAAR
jgi:pimeloyl-ACP methyl ester carboxylesterase